MALALVVLGLILWLAGIAPLIGIICLIVGVVLLAAASAPYGGRGRYW